MGIVCTEATACRGAQKHIKSELMSKIASVPVQSVKRSGANLLEITAALGMIVLLYWNTFNLSKDISVELCLRKYRHAEFRISEFLHKSVLKAFYRNKERRCRD